MAATLLAVLGLVGTLVQPQPAAAQAQADPAGNYTVAFDAQSIPTDLANGAILAGRWRLGFETDGTYQAERLDLGVLVNGTWSVDGDTITITDQNGIASCTNAALESADEGDVSAGTYTWALTGGRLTLTPKEDGCALRRILLSQKELTTYVPCTTVVAPTGSEATPVGDGGGVIGSLPPAANAPQGKSDKAEVEKAIDELLGQMTSCWATGDPERFLPLLSSNFRASFAGGTAQDQASAKNQLDLAMGVPITWERAGDVTLTDDTHASAVVRTTAADQEEFVRYNFVLEDGHWLWDGQAG
jgi:hypothetical protein